MHYVGAEISAVTRAQVDKLLFSLNIDPVQLPSGPAATQNWDRLYAQGTSCCAPVKPAIHQIRLTYFCKEAEEVRLLCP